MVKIFLYLLFNIFLPLTFLIGITSCLNDLSNNPVNKRVSLDTSSSKELMIQGAFPALNSEIAQVNAIRGDYYLATNIDGPDKKFEVVLNNPLEEAYCLLWKKDGVTMTGSDINSLTSFISVSASTFSSSPLSPPSSLSGIHTIEVYLYRDSCTDESHLVEGRKWLIDYLNGTENFSHIVTSGVTPASGVSLTYSKSVSTQVDFSVTISDAFSFGYEYRWYINDILVSAPGRNASSPAIYSWFLENVSNGSYTIKLDIRDHYYMREIESFSWLLTITD